LPRCQGAGRSTCYTLSVTAYWLFFRDYVLLFPSFCFLLFLHSSTSSLTSLFSHFSLHPVPFLFLSTSFLSPVSLFIFFTYLLFLHFHSFLLSLRFVIMIISFFFILCTFPLPIYFPFSFLSSSFTLLLIPHINFLLISQSDCSPWERIPQGIIKRDNLCEERNLFVQKRAKCHQIRCVQRF